MYFTPLVPNNIKPYILTKAQNICINSAKLSFAYNHEFIKSLEELFKIVQVFYANKLENQDLNHEYIYKAKKGHFNLNAKIKNLQSLSLSFLQTTEYTIKNAYLYKNPFSKELICDIHERFYFGNNMENFLKMTTQGTNYFMQPGMLRDLDVLRRGEQSPNFSLLNTILHYFANSYSTCLNQDKVTQLIYAICSYHRLIWIHPFLFANERIAKIYLTFLFDYIGIEGHKLWSICRGLHRRKKEYKQVILSADKASKFSSNTELCEHGLEDFLVFMLDVISEEIDFSLNHFAKIPQRILNYIKLSQNNFFDKEPLPKQSELLFEKLLIYGEFPRGEIKQLINKQTRASTYFIKKLNELDFIYSDTPRGNLKLNFNIHLASKLFPKLFPD